MEAEMRSFCWPFMIRERRSYETLLAAAEETSVANIDTVDKIVQRIRRVLTGVGFVEQSFAIFCSVKARSNYRVPKNIVYEYSWWWEFW